MSSSTSSSEGRPALGAFLTRLVLFVVVAALLGVAQGVLYERVVMKESTVVRVIWQFHAASQPIRVLVVGDSHTATGVDPALLGEAFNFSGAMRSPCETWFLLKYVLEESERGDAIETIILAYDPTSFAAVRADRVDKLYYWRRYVDFAELGRLKGRRLEYLALGARAWLVPQLGEGRVVLAWLRTVVLGSRPLAELRDGHELRGGVFVPGSAAVRQADTAVALHFRGDTIYHDDLLACFDRTLELCRQRGIDVILLTCPVTREYLELARPRFEGAPGRERLERVLARHPEVRHLDHEELWLDRHELFDDADHLNAQGARLFSERLTSELGLVAEDGDR